MSFLFAPGRHAYHAEGADLERVMQMLQGVPLCQRRGFDHRPGKPAAFKRQPENDKKHAGNDTQGFPDGFSVDQTGLVRLLLCGLPWNPQASVFFRYLMQHC
jgi:hypothetical protein